MARYVRKVESVSSDFIEGSRNNATIFSNLSSGGEARRATFILGSIHQKDNVRFSFQRDNFISPFVRSKRTDVLQAFRFRLRKICPHVINAKEAIGNFNRRTFSSMYSLD